MKITPGKAEVKYDPNGHPTPYDVVVGDITVGLFANEDAAVLYADARNTYDTSKELPSDLLRDKKAGWNGLANIYEIIRGTKCDERTALGMATSAASELKRKMDEVNEDLRWRDPEKELPLDPLTRCEVLSHDQAFIAWLGEDDGPTYWILDAPMDSEVGDVTIPNVRAWRPASIDSKTLNPPLPK